MHKSLPRRVVVTGLGVVSSIGIGWQEFWPNLLAGKSGISEITAFDTTNHDRHLAGEVKNFDPTRFIDRRKIPYLGRSAQMAIAASKMAIADAGLNLPDVASRMSVCVGVTMSEMTVLEKFHSDYCSLSVGAVSREKRLSSFPADCVGSNIASRFKLKRNNGVFSTACSAGNYSIGHGFDAIRSGKVDFVLAGGADSLSRVVFAGFERLNAVAPQKCQPFDRDRKGMIPAEGAAIVLLESAESAEKRKAKIYAEIAGYGLSCDAHNMVNPHAPAIAKAISKAVRSSGVMLDDVDYICAHGTGTAENDKAECAAIKAVFGSRAAQIPVSSIKSMLGHAMGAASALEAVACCLAIESGQIPPTINFEQRDDDCDIDCVPNQARRRKVEVVLNNSSAFGGNNACVVLKKVF